MKPLTKEELWAARLIRKIGNIKQFIEFCFSDEKDNPIILAPHHVFLHDWLDDCDKKGHTKRMIQMPFESGKTQNVSIYRNLWDMGKNLNIRCKLFAANESLAMNRTAAIKTNIEYNIRLQAVFPKLKPSKDDWGKSSLTVQRSAMTLTDPTFEARGILSSVMGGRIDKLVLDDVTDYLNSLSQVKREAIKGAVKANVMSRKSSECITDVIGTPWHPDDALSSLFKPPEWQTLRMPIKKDLSCFEVFVNGVKVEELPMWERLSAEIIEEKKRDPAYGLSMVKAGIFLEHYSLGKKIFQGVENYIAFNSDPDSFEYKRICGGIDYSSAKREGTVAVLVGLRKDGKKIPIDPRFLSKPESLPSHLVDQTNIYPVDSYNAESNATQSVITAMIRPYRIGVAIRDYTTGANKKDPRSGLPRIADEINEGYWLFCIPHSPPMCSCNYCRLAQQFILASWADENTPDGVMAAWFADEGLRHRLTHRVVIVAK